MPYIEEEPLPATVFSEQLIKFTAVRRSGARSRKKNVPAGRIHRHRLRVATEPVQATIDAFSCNLILGETDRGESPRSSFRRGGTGPHDLRMVPRGNSNSNDPRPIVAAL